MFMRGHPREKACGLSLVIAVLVSTGCGSNVKFAIGQTSQSFTQSGGTVNGEIDVLWVVDNSGSMAPFQANLTSNFSSFISKFQTQGYDFRMTVTATDAYKANTNFTQYSSSNSSLSLFQDGQGSTTSGVFVILPSTPNLPTVFVDNATTGVNGSGDERAFSSMMTTLTNPANPAFLRQSSFLAIIILSDEDDFSNYSRTESSWGNNAAADHCYYNTAMDTASTTAYSGTNHVATCQGLNPPTPPDSVASYEAALDTLTQSTGATRRWNLSTIAVLDSACQLSHSQDPSNNNAAFVSVVGQRYMQMSQDTQGIEGSICDTSFANSLSNISAQISVLTTQFFLSRVPQISTISVMVNGALVPQDPNNGWTYNSAANSIQFHGSSTPPKNATVTALFTPVSI